MWTWKAEQNQHRKGHSESKCQCLPARWSIRGFPVWFVFWRGLGGSVATMGGKWPPCPKKAFPFEVPMLCLKINEHKGHRTQLYNWWINYYFLPEEGNKKKNMNYVIAPGGSEHNKGYTVSDIAQTTRSSSRPKGITVLYVHSMWIHSGLQIILIHRGDVGCEA